jgi:hypothetical protein
MRVRRAFTDAHVTSHTGLLDAGRAVRGLRRLGKRIVLAVEGDLYLSRAYCCATVVGDGFQVPSSASGWA